ncbi:MAG: bis(5'-nucleosyl)-tetraphosphatase (symmetrical) YqeK [Clostridiales bacterium]
MDLNAIIGELKERLSNKRFNHSIGVMNAAEKLAIRYNGNVEKAKLAGLLHDYAKELTKSEFKKYINEFELYKIIDINESVFIFHGLISAKLVSQKYNINDYEILEAISWHTTGKANMSLLEKIVYVADLIEENRNFQDIDFFRKLAFENLERSIIYSCNIVVKKLIDNNSLINKNTIEARNYLILKEKGVI